MEIFFIFLAVFALLYIVARIIHKYVLLTHTVQPKKCRNGLKIHSLVGDVSFDIVYKEHFEDDATLQHGLTIDHLIDPAAKEGGPPPLLIDVGANIGLWSLAMLRKLPRCEIVQFEPVPLLAECCRLNTSTATALSSSSNGVCSDSQHKVTLHQIGLGSKDEENKVSFLFKPGLSAGTHCADLLTSDPLLLAPPQGTSMFRVLRAAIRDALSVGTLPRFIAAPLINLLDVPVLNICVLFLLIPAGIWIAAGHTQVKVESTIRSLTSVLEETGLRGRKIDYLKIDVEGFEEDVVQGIDEATWKQVDQCMIEVHDGKNGRIQRMQTMLERLGFEVEIGRDAFAMHELIPIATIFATKLTKKKKQTTNESKKLV